MAVARTRHWVIGDVHGCHQSLLNLLAVLPSSDHLVFLGDVINRGAATEASMDLVWDLVMLGRATWLRGNHEQDRIEALQAFSDASTQQWLHRLEQLPLVYRADGWIATHAGFNSKGEPDLSIRDPFWESYDGRYGLVVIGHTPRPQLERIGRIVLIDTGAVYGGLLSAYCPETDAVVQVPGAFCSTAFPRPQDEGRIPAVLAGEPSTC